MHKSGRATHSGFHSWHRTAEVIHRIKTSSWCLTKFDWGCLSSFSPWKRMTKWAIKRCLCQGSRHCDGVVYFLSRSHGPQHSPPLKHGWDLQKNMEAQMSGPNCNSITAICKILFPFRGSTHEAGFPMASLLPQSIFVFTKFIFTLRRMVNYSN